MYVKNRSYRRELTSHGVISFGDESLKVTLKNLSMTGLLAELLDDMEVYNMKQFFYATEGAKKIEINLPEMYLSGSAEIIRFDDKGDTSYVALEFKNLTYKRQVTRKRLMMPKTLVSERRVPVLVEEKKANVA